VAAGDVSSFNTQIDAIVTALGSSDFAAARLAYAKAVAYHTALAVSEGKQGASVTRRQRLDELLEAIKVAEADSSSGIYEERSGWFLS
jgi:hypothetical protein